jgi:Bacterial HORMA domain family 1
MTYSVTTSDTFSIIHARKLSSKVAADMHLCAQYYGLPSEQSIREYAEELAQYLNEGYVQEYEFGYQKNGQRLVTWRYKVDENGTLTTDDRPGKVVPSVEVAGATFFNYMIRNSRFWNLTGNQREAFENTLPFARTVGDPPSDGKGYWTSDRNYYSGGRGLARQTFQPTV